MLSGMRQCVAPPRPEYLDFLAPFGAGMVDLALATRTVVVREAPAAVELIYDAYNAVATGYSFTGRPSDAFIHIAVYANWVNLGFNRGSELADPDGLLHGTGRRIRHIRISSIQDLQNPALRTLVRNAIAGAKPASAEQSGIGKSVVRAIYPKRRRPSR